MSGKKPIGRPKQPPRRQFSISLSEEHYLALEKLAAGKALTIAEYVRLQIFGDSEMRSKPDEFEGGIPLPRNRADFERLVTQAGLEFHSLVQTYTDHMKRVEDVARRTARGEAVSPMDELFYGSGESREPETGKVIARRKPEDK